jgi:hypothetical protein
MSAEPETNLLSFRHRPWRGALLGDLAVVEMTSDEPMRPYRRALVRCGVGPDGLRFGGVHVGTDATKESSLSATWFPG